MKKILLLISMFFMLVISIDVYASGYLQPDYTILELYTPNGSVVEYFRYDFDMSQEYKELLLEEYDSYEIIGEPTFYYNCHAYAWYFEGDLLPTSASQSCWINDPTAYINDGSYVEISIDEVMIGDIVTYWSGTRLVHSGLVANYSIIDTEDIESIYVESKFGEGPLIRHLLTNADSYYNDDTIVRFYTKHYHLISSYTSISQTMHTGYCQSCEKIIVEQHNIYREGLFYRCTECNYKETFIPIIKNGITYYLYAGDDEQKLMSKDEMLLYLIKTNNLNLIEKFDQVIA